MLPDLTPDQHASAVYDELIESIQAMKKPAKYKLLKKKDDMSSNNDVGSPAFLVSHKWLEKYHKFILYDQFE